MCTVYRMFDIRHRDWSRHDRTFIRTAAWFHLDSELVIQGDADDTRLRINPLYVIKSGEQEVLLQVLFISDILDEHVHGPMSIHIEPCVQVVLAVGGQY